MRILQVLDSHNLLHTTKMKYQGKIDYIKVFKERSVIVGFQAQSFENFLRAVGYEVSLSKNPPENALGTTMLIAQASRIPCDHLILGTQDRNVIPFIQVMQGKGVFVEIFGAGIPTDLRTTANKWTEVMEDHLCGTTV